MGSVRTAVFPVAGLGTRFLPATKALPKELLPVVDRPLIQYAVDEAVEAGIESFIFVTGRGKTAIENHFDVSYELESLLSGRNDNETLALLDSIRPTPGQVAYVRQMEPLGLGHAVWCARNLVGDEPFAVILADDLLQPTGEALSAMIAEHQRTGANIVLVEEVDPNETDQYGIVSSVDNDGQSMSVSAIVEKPAPEDAPSNLGVVGRYILDPSIMDILERTVQGSGGEIQLTDALSDSLERTDLRAIVNTGVRFDCGSRIGLIEATIAMALERDDLGPDVRILLKKYL
jgi:UTP--glucose-1-phosphate uridylyltransferase